jgi:hypothetical protein
MRSQNKVAVIQWVSTVWHHYNHPVETTLYVTGLSCPVLLDLSSGTIHGLPIANAAGLSARDHEDRHGRLQSSA